METAPNYNGILGIYVYIEWVEDKVFKDYGNEKSL